MNTVEEHKHCVFCGETVRVTYDPKNIEEMICHSPRNTLTPDTVGRRYHATIALDNPAVGRRG